MLDVVEITAVKSTLQKQVWPGIFAPRENSGQKSPAQTKQSYTRLARGKKGILTMNEATLHKEHLDLLGLVVPHFSVIGAEERRYYLRTENRLQLPGALTRGFVLPKTEAGVSALPTRVPIPSQEVEWWNRYWRDHYGVRESFEKLTTPVPPEFPVRLLAMHWQHSSRCNKIAEVYAKRCNGKWWQYANDIDASVISHVRGGTYAIWVPDTREAEFGWDEKEKRNLSSQDVWDRNLAETTLPERLVDGDAYLLKRKEHLDQEVVNICPGSRGSDGGVPSVRLNGDGKVYVNDWNPGSTSDRLRFRLEISRNQRSYKAPFCV